MKRIKEILTKSDIWIIFDLETTGLNKTEHQIIQISAIKYRVNDGKFTEIGRLDRLINPEILIPRNITAITGITNEMLEGQEAFEEAFPEIREFFKGVTGFCGYNVGFDIGFLEEAYKKMKAPSPFEKAEILDALVYAREYVGDRTPNHKLETITRFFGVANDIRFHRAIDDVTATHRVVEHLIEMEEQWLIA